MHTDKIPQHLRFQAPFTISEASPAKIANEIAETYSYFNANPPQATAIWRALISPPVAPSQLFSSLARAGFELTKALDAGIGTGIEKGYHNKAHFLEVLMNASYLMRYNNILSLEKSEGIVFSPEEITAGLFAALAHDFYYEPGGNVDGEGNPAPYRLEHISFTKARTYLERAAVPESIIDQIGVMIYGTDVSASSRAGSFIRAAHASLFENKDVPVVTDVLERVEPVLHDPRLAHMAALISDSDILSSAGLTFEYSAYQQARLGIELGKEAGPKDTIGFLQHVAGNKFTTEAARFFQPNMDAIHQRAEAASLYGNTDLLRYHRARVTMPHLPFS